MWIIRSNSWLHVGPPKIQTQCLRDCLKASWTPAVWGCAHCPVPVPVPRHPPDENVQMGKVSLGGKMGKDKKLSEVWILPMWRACSQLLQQMHMGTVASTLPAEVPERWQLWWAKKAGTQLSVLVLYESSGTAISVQWGVSSVSWSVNSGCLQSLITSHSKENHLTSRFGW